MDLQADVVPTALPQELDQETVPAQVSPAETEEESKEASGNSSVSVGTTNAEISLKTGKPKKILTEAQRLAFMKGREKRLANLEKRRQEKLEAKQFETQAPETQVLEEEAIPAADATPLAEQVAQIVLDRLSKIKTPPTTAEEKPPKKPRVKREKKVAVIVDPPAPAEEVEEGEVAEAKTPAKPQFLWV